MVSLSIIFLLVISEFYAYLTPTTTDHLYVDTSRGAGPPSARRTHTLHLLAFAARPPPHASATHASATQASGYEST